MAYNKNDIDDGLDFQKSKPSQNSQCEICKLIITKSECTINLGLCCACYERKWNENR